MFHLFDILWVLLRQSSSTGLVDGFAIPDGNNGDHLDTLIAISTQLMNPDICQKLRDASSLDEITSIFA